MLSIRCYARSVAPAGESRALDRPRSSLPRYRCGVEEGDLVDLFAEEFDAEDTPAGEQLQLLTSIASLYEAKGLLRDGFAPPLWECCPNAAACWARAAPGTQPSDGEANGGIPLPWIGPAYRRGGVVVVAINLRNASGLMIEYVITCWPDGQLDTLSRGGSKPHGSDFAYRATRSAAALVDIAEGRRAEDHVQPTELPSYLRRTARLQAVKCSPHDGAMSDRTPEMRRNCPPFLLADEVDILRPGFILTVGSEPRDAMDRVDGYEYGGSAERLHHGTLRRPGWSARVICLDHPGARNAGWARGHEQMLKLLRP
jgi:hypothetical protein